MGVTINHRLAAEKRYIKSILDRAQAFAENIKKEAQILKIAFKIRRLSETELFIDIGGCETLTFDFKTMNDWNAVEGWGYEKETLKYFEKFDTDPNESYYKEHPEFVLHWASAFCKTQYANNIAEHKFVAEIIRMVAGYCQISEIGDEGDYYYSGQLEDAAGAIEENGALINSLGKQLAENFSADNIIKGGETKIKKAKK